MQPRDAFQKGSGVGLGVAVAPVGVGGAKSLATSEKFAGLRFLHLDGAKLHDSGVAALAESPHLRELLWLDLSSNSVHKGAEGLLDPANLPALSHCDLQANPIEGGLYRRLKRRRKAVKLSAR